jgi:hypothetical protein
MDSKTRDKYLKEMQAEFVNLAQTHLLLAKNAGIPHPITVSCITHALSLILGIFLSSIPSEDLEKACKEFISQAKETAIKMACKETKNSTS